MFSKYGYEKHLFCPKQKKKEEKNWKKTKTF